MLLFEAALFDLQVVEYTGRLLFPHTECSSADQSSDHKCSAERSCRSSDHNSAGRSSRLGIVQVRKIFACTLRLCFVFV